MLPRAEYEIVAEAGYQEVNYIYEGSPLFGPLDFATGVTLVGDEGVVFTGGGLETQQFLQFNVNNAGVRFEGLRPPAGHGARLPIRSGRRHRVGLGDARKLQTHGRT